MFENNEIDIKIINFLNQLLLILGEYPIGQEVEYNGNMGKQRITSEEKRAIERSHYDDYNDARRAAEAHRQVIQTTFFINYLFI